ncbi:MAG: S8 family serine peptidase [candidate division Zixibacteria bacterium]|nr:S8 family serine peptidase [candidate division Zixibacteria bacterium]
MKRFFFLTIILSLSLLLSNSAMSGYLHPSINLQFEEKPELEYHSVIVSLEEQAPISEINESLKARRATLAERHEVVLTTLQQVASASQPEFENILRAGMESGEVIRYESLWLINAFRVDATEGFIKELGARNDVMEIALNFEIESIAPVETKESEGIIAGVETGVEVINAPAAWDRGFTGAGRLVSHLDTGVNGNHPSLDDRWRGLDPQYAGHPEWAWYDPVTNTDFPFDAGTHGTHTMGTICGADHNSGDTVGVAIDAEWISAGVIDRVDIPTTIADAFTAFQWIADPDGNPGTTFDVPDVCSNSWGISPIYHSGYTYPCDPYFWTVNDNCEAAGAAIVFAAGNEGYWGSNSLRTPADRGSTPYATFAVGAVNGNQSGYPIADFSSRGPSDCGPYTTKPEVVAPGVDVRSSYSYGGYTTMSGTSMACPHVAGAICILRQAAPNASIDELKEALMMTAYDLGPNGEDNTYGWGLIDVNAAIDYLGGGPDLDITMTPDNPPIEIDPPGSFTFDGVLENTTDQYQTTDVWIMIDVPGYGMFGPVLRYNNLTLAPNQTLNVYNVNQNVPAYAPAGMYEYISYCGDYPSDIVDQSSFEFRVLGEGGGGMVDFEDVPEQYWYFGGGQNLGGFYSGLNFGSSVTILESQVYGYNDTGYPPHSGYQVAFTADVPTIRVDFDALTDHVGVWYTVGSGTLYLEAYNSGGGLIDNTSGGENYGTNDFMEVNGSNIAYVLIHDSADFYTIDDFEWGNGGLAAIEGKVNIEDWSCTGWGEELARFASMENKADGALGREGQIPTNYGLNDAYPNPFNAQTNITYSVPESGNVSLEVFNLMGQKVATLVNGNVEAGVHTITWDANQHSSGIYFYKLTAGDKNFTKRMTLLK